MTMVEMTYLGLLLVSINMPLAVLLGNLLIFVFFYVVVFLLSRVNRRKVRSICIYALDLHSSIKSMKYRMVRNHVKMTRLDSYRFFFFGPPCISHIRTASVVAAPWLILVW